MLFLVFSLLLTVLFDRFILEGEVLIYYLMFLLAPPVRIVTAEFAKIAEVLHLSFSASSALWGESVVCFLTKLFFKKGGVQ